MHSGLRRLIWLIIVLIISLNLHIIPDIDNFDAALNEKVYGACLDTLETSADKLPGKNITMTNGEKAPFVIQGVGSNFKVTQHG